MQFARIPPPENLARFATRPNHKPTSDLIESDTEGLCETACLLLDAGAAIVSLYCCSTGTTEILHRQERDPGMAAALIRAIKGMRLDRRRHGDGLECLSTTVGSVATKTLIIRPNASVAVVLTVGCEPASLPVNPAAERALARMLDLWWRVRCGDIETRALQRVIDMSEVGVLVLDAKMRITFANRRAHVLLDDADGLVPQGAGVTAYQLDDAIRLQVILRHIIEREAPDESKIPLFPIRRVGRRSLMTTVVSSGGTCLQPEDPAAILLLVDPEQNVLQMLGACCALYGLTETESRLTQHLVAGLTITEAAETMRIQCATARTYLKQVFAKTDTHRQTDLVRLMLLSVIRTPGAARLQAVG